MEDVKYVYCTECPYCGRLVPSVAEAAPDRDDDAAWEAMATLHHVGCEWVQTRAHRQQTVYVLQGAGASGMGHTPGPWRVISGTVETEKGIPIAYMDREPGNGTNPVERDENAHLIASAPALAAENARLRAALHSTIRLSMYQPIGSAQFRRELSEAVQQARAALSYEKQP